MPLPRWGKRIPHARRVARRAAAEAAVGRVARACRRQTHGGPGVSTLFPIPTGWTRSRPLTRPCGLLLRKIPFAVSQTAQVHHSAQGCPVGGTTLGNVVHYFFQPQRGCITSRRADGCNPFRVVEFSGRSPRVARSSQPWAESRSPVGANEFRTRAALRVPSAGKSVNHTA